MFFVLQHTGKVYEHPEGNRAQFEQKHVGSQGELEEECVINN